MAAEPPSRHEDYSTAIFGLGLAIADEVLSTEPGAILVGPPWNSADDDQINERSRCETFTSSKKILRRRAAPR
jgi:hypothetical protein